MPVYSDHAPENDSKLPVEELTGQVLTEAADVDGAFEDTSVALSMPKV
jgi:hypothetical protein